MKMKKQYNIRKVILSMNILSKFDKFLMNLYFFLKFKKYLKRFKKYLEKGIKDKTYTV